MKLFKWARDFLQISSNARKKVVLACLEAVKIHDKGNHSEQGQKLYDFLTSKKAKLIGVVPNIAYMMVDSKEADHLDCLWIHDFSIPTLLYKIEGEPYMVLVNANMEYNNSKLLENPENKHDVESLRLKGIIG